MAWEWTDLIGPTAGAILGYAGGRLALWQDRRAADAARRAEWKIRHSQGDVWTLMNVGDGDATNVSVELSNAKYTQSLLNVKFLDSFPVDGISRGESQDFYLSRCQPGATAVVSWIDEKGKKQVSRRVSIPLKPRG